MSKLLDINKRRIKWLRIVHRGYDETFQSKYSHKLYFSRRKTVYPLIYRWQYIGFCTETFEELFSVIGPSIHGLWEVYDIEKGGIKRFDKLKEAKSHSEKTAIYNN